MLLAIHVVVDVGDGNLPRCLDGEVLYLLELYWLLTFGVQLEIVVHPIVIRYLMQLEWLGRNLLRTLRVFSHRLGLKDRPLVPLTFQDSLLALVLFDVWNVRRAA